ncbi:hypothetical protein L3X38_030352 [Prunus dulcis]|uniref:EGF-like domain-containing protein n=1 Tax=Prunus dulcis TaxID=3755 RepID=A0AAD4VBB0_PRUDU|nr:hypothetical protein L3X38_030352 [Prunus dulcis]
MASLGSLSLEQASKYGMLIFLVIFNHDGSVYLESEDRVILRTILSNTFSMQDFYQRATLEYNGVLRYYYVYPKRSSSNMRSPRAWSTSSYMPSNICASISEETGGGVCGFNSLCRHDDQGPSCHCPNGYSFIDPNDVLKGCKQDFVSQSCDKTSQETDHFHFEAIRNTDWPNSDYDHFQEVSEDWCRQECLGDFFCAVAIFKTN